MNGDGDDDMRSSRDGGGVPVRAVFFGNLRYDTSAGDVAEIFERPLTSVSLPEHDFDPNMPIHVDRVDMKRGFCFVFFKSVKTEAERARAEDYIIRLNGMSVDKVSDAMRAEFARGDGKVKRKEDMRRQNIKPNETLFVVGFHQETTKREDLEMLFGPYGNLVRIDMKDNYAFVQYTTIDEATKAKDATNNGKLDQSIITVEYVASERGARTRRYGDGSPPRGRGGSGRYDDRPRDRDGRGGGRYDDRYARDRSPPRDRYRDRSPPRGGNIGSRYDDRYRDRSPPRGGDRYDDRRRSPPRSSLGAGVPRSRSIDRFDSRRAVGLRERSRSRSPIAYRRRSRSPPGSAGRFRDYDKDEYLGRNRRRSPEFERAAYRSDDRGYAARGD